MPYFHFVFALPAAIGAMAYQNKAKLYGLLFKAASETLITIAADRKHLGADIGVIAVLHTWGQNLQHHPHVHCVVPGGGISLDGKHWIACRPGFFLPVRVLSRLFRRLFLEGLMAAFEAGELQFFADLAYLNQAKAFAAALTALRTVEWAVYAKRTFAGPEQLLAYLARYTHRVAITNNRLLELDESHVTFRWKKARQGGGHKHKVMCIQTWSSCAASSSTSYRMAFIAFVTMVSWRTAIVPTSSHYAEACSERLQRRRIIGTTMATIYATQNIKHPRANAAAAA